jgi:chorismate-pyruvate lyase
MTYDDTEINQRPTVGPQSFKETIMKRMLFVSAMALMVCAISVQAQDSISTTRVELQHEATRSMGKRLAQHEQNLLKSLENENPVVQAQAVQTIRELEQMFPKYPFSASLAPLGAKLKDEKADGVVRRLAALALDEHHSDAGDAIIRDVATSTQDVGLQTLCNALLVRGLYN